MEAAGRPLQAGRGAPQGLAASPEACKRFNGHELTFGTELSLGKPLAVLFRGAQRFGEARGEGGVGALEQPRLVSEGARPAGIASR